MTGTLANDTVRRIEEIGKDHKKGDYGATREELSISHAEKIEESGNPERGPRAKNIVKCTNDLDLAFEYYEELCDIVSDTVSAYCPWFVTHWLCYGATFVIEIIFMSELELTFSRDALQLSYITVIVVMTLYSFLLPCMCTAYIADTCGGMVRINYYWENYDDECE